MKKNSLIVLAASIFFFGYKLIADDFITKGDFLFKSGDYAEALNIYSSAFQDDKNIENTLVYFKIALTNFKMNRYEESLKNLKRVLELDKTYADAYFLKGRIEESKNEIANAMGSYNSYVEYATNKDSDVIFYIGNFFFKNCYYETAFKLFSKDKSDLRNIFGAANSARFIGEYKAAIKNYEKVIKSNVNFYEAYIGLAISYQMLKNVEKAIYYFEKYLEYIETEDVYIALANLYLSKQDNRAAKKVVEKALNRFKNSLRLKNLLVEIYSKG